MHVILRPSSRDDLEPIVVTGTLFAIGRQEPPFNSYDGELVAKLSRRHARLFDQDGSVYLADLGSLNGTTCNGEAVKHVPVELHTGDLVEFGGLGFEAEVEVQQQAEPATAAPAVQRLVLTPERYKEVLEPIVVSSFPFLFDKSGELFARHKSELRDVLAYMSRHHAHIFLRDDELYVEDLGSTNGTYVSGRKLDERAHHLKDGDTIALGSDRLVYSVHLLRNSEEGVTQLPSGIEAVDNPTRTIFVDSPTSFLDVYFVGEKRSQTGSPDAASNNGAAGDKGGDARVSLLTQMSRSFFGGPVFGPTVRRSLALVVLAAGVATTFWYWQGRELRAIENAMAAENYAQAVRLARDYLAANPDAGAVRELATEAALHLWVPTWMEHVEAAEYAEAVAVTEQAAATVPGNADAEAVFELLEWSARARRLVADGPARDSVNRAIERGKAVEELLDWWQQDTYSRARTLDLVGGTLAAFQSAREQVYSDVRRMRLEALDYEPLLDLDRRITSALERRDLATVRREIADFIDDNGQFADARVLEQDLARLERLEAHVANRRWLAGVTQLADDPFVTVPFVEYGAELRERSLPDAATLAGLDEIRTQWHTGQLDAALAGLEALARGNWPSLGAALEDRYRELQSGYQALQAARGQPNYATSLFQYYGQLREAEDGYLLEQLEDEFRDHADGAAQQAAVYLQEARAAWAAYQDEGGIEPEHRLAERVSGVYTRLAGQLKRAADAFRRGQRIHELIDRPVPAEWQSLRQDLAQEVAYQRNQVSGVALHGPEMRRQLLGLLPEPLQ